MVGGDFTQKNVNWEGGTPHIKTRIRFKVFSLEQALDTFSNKLAPVLNQA